MPDPTDPKHYNKLKIQPRDYITANKLDYNEGNVVKYVSRWRNKNGLEDLLKAKHYIDMAIDRDYPEEVKEEIKETKNSWGIVK